jgi:hypothetical protein
MSSQSVDEQIEWTTGIITAAMLGDHHFFESSQFRDMLQGFEACIKADRQWDEVS